MKNKKVPVAILSCFLIAFILQGALKLSGIFVFEKALTWDIFKIIDNSLALTIIYNILINIIAVYCLSFALTTKPYSTKWWHYVIIICASSIIIILKYFINTPQQFQFLFDIVNYILVPMLINITTSKQNRISITGKYTNIVITLASHILLYFCYLGLAYWSSLLNSFIPIEQTTPYASTILLIYFEMYIGLISLMLSLNVFINQIKGGKD